MEGHLPPPVAGKGPHRRQNGSVLHKLRTILTRFRQALVSEETFYRQLITRIVAFYQLQDLVRPALASVGIPVTESVEGGGPDQGLAPFLSEEEKEKKVGLIYKGLVCLGDLERYKEQYGEKHREEIREGMAHVTEDMYRRPKTYYEVARSLQPDNGECPTWLC
jgi:hypothetical protein